MAKEKESTLNDFLTLKENRLLLHYVLRTYFSHSVVDDIHIDGNDTEIKNAVLLLKQDMLEVCPDLYHKLKKEL